MKHGFLKVACATPKIKVADCDYNTNEIIKIAEDAYSKHIKLLVFPELCITAYSCSDLFYSPVLLNSALTSLKKYIDATASFDLLSVVGLPVLYESKIYNCAAVVKGGKLLGIVPKANIPTYCEFYEGRQFAPCPEKNGYMEFFGQNVPFGKNIIFKCRSLPSFRLGIEICEDIWVTIPPSSKLSLAGATVFANLSASNETIGKDDYRRLLVTSQSAKTISAYIYASCGEGESTTDVVFSGHCMIAENGTLLAQRNPFDHSESKITVSEIDLERISVERRKRNTFLSEADNNIIPVYFDFAIEETKITRFIDPHPFVPADQNERSRRANIIRSIQSYGLKQRIEASHSEKCVIGISGGLDSCLALLSTVHTYDLMKRDRKNIIAITMPCFGTTKRTRSNAQLLSEELGVDFREINITDAVSTHFRDIDHSPENRNVVYENSQARERTQVLMDIANEENALVIGTGDLSELALGWATYNGDHMSMYGINSSIPKTLVRHIVAFCAEEYKNAGKENISNVLYDILDTPVSPELLPAIDGNIAQMTEDLVGPYEIHDFYLYYMLRFAFSPDKLFRLAKIALGETYDDPTLLKWLKIFIKRFFSQQFKRSCLPDGPKVGSVALSPRGDWRMPSDASAAEWLRSVDSIKI